LRLQSLLGPGSRHCYGIITLNDLARHFSKGAKSQSGIE
jgi:hypothetical protein